MEQQTAILRLTKAFAGQYGLVIGGLWTASFLCSMYSLDIPLVGHIGNFTALLSLLAEIRLLKKFQKEHFPLPFLYRWSMAIRIGMYASLLTTMAQYLYFRFVDNGHILSSMEKLLSVPEYQAILKQANTPYTGDQLISLMSSVQTGDMVLSLLVLNMLIALLFSIVGTMASNTGASSRETDTQHTHE